MGEFEKTHINDREAAWHICNNMERHSRFENTKRHKHEEFFEHHSTFKKILNQGDDFCVRKNLPCLFQTAAGRCCRNPSSASWTSRSSSLCRKMTKISTRLNEIQSQRLNYEKLQRRRRRLDRRGGFTQQERRRRRCGSALPRCLWPAVGAAVLGAWARSHRTTLLFQY